VSNVPRSPLTIAVLSVTALLAAPAAAYAGPSEAVATQSELSVSPSTGDNSPHTINVSFAGGAYTVTDFAGVSAGPAALP
jgi:hypothetical protein